MSKRVTIQDIADSLGISRNTVSRAINNSEGLSDAMRERILQKAVEMGYKQFSYVSTLNMTEEQKEKVYGVDSSTLAKGPTLQELNEENPTYVKREYDHKQQVVVGSVVMFCVALAMVLMNNYNPKR